MDRKKIARAAVAFALSLALGGAGAGVARAAGGWQWPVSGRVITPYRNGTDRFAGGQHRGIDIAAPVGTPVVAASGGTVSFAGVAGSSGLTVAVRTSGGDLETTYLHLSSVAVRAGQRVSGGDPIGAVGVSGRRSAEQPHLHFGVRDAADRFAYRDPLDFLPPPAAEPRPASPAPRAVPVAAPVPGLRAPKLVPLARVPALAPRLVSPRGEPTGAPALARRPHAVAVPAPSPSAGPQAVKGMRPHSAPLHPSAAGSDHGAHAAGGANGAARFVPMAGPQAKLPPRAQPAVRSPAGVGRGGADLGWLAACGGLVLAAALLGRPAGPRETIRRTQQRVTTWLRPLSGRG
ncbi:MAG: hypothetical protein QOD53_2414 [Thermoleophilaceae bacterium]|jgi:hypothetical protein|nr:hypothetical protein [Thermoleophilaceae bacterium]